MAPVFGLMALGCGDNCEPGDLMIAVSTRDVFESASFTGPASIVRLGSENFVVVFDDYNAAVDASHVPQSLFPDGAQVYAILNMRERPDGFAPTELSTYTLEGTSKGALLSAAWGSDVFPQLDGVELTSSAHCTAERDCGAVGFVDTHAKLADGRAISAAPGEAEAQGSLRLGNGWSEIPSEACAGKEPWFVGYLAVAP